MTAGAPGRDEPEEHNERRDHEPSDHGAERARRAGRRRGGGRRGDLSYGAAAWPPAAPRHCQATGCEGACRRSPR